jgi:hypothetical protein
MPSPDPSNREDVARWAAGITLGLNGPVGDGLDVQAYFVSGDHRIFYASVFNQTTAYQIQKYSSFHWKCCIEADNLRLKTGKELVSVVEEHLVAAAVPKAATNLWFVKTNAGGTQL